LQCETFRILLPCWMLFCAIYIWLAISGSRELPSIFFKPVNSNMHFPIKTLEINATLCSVRFYSITHSLCFCWINQQMIDS
jgi:hypothetical protein